MISSYIGSWHVSKRAFFLQLYLSFCVLMLLVGPRLVIMDYAASSIRVDDLVAFSMAGFVLVNYRKLTPNIPTLYAMLVLTLSGVASAMVAFVSEHLSLSSGILYASRNMEYWLIVPVCFIIFKFDQARTQRTIDISLACVTILQTSFAIAQQIFKLEIGFASFSTERGSGLTKGPYELGAIALMLCIYWIYKRKPILATVAALALMVSLSRVSILAAAICSLIFLIFTLSKMNNNKIKISPPFFLAVAVLIVGIIGLFPKIESLLIAPVVNRVGTTSIGEAWETSGVIASRVDSSMSSADYQVVAFESFQYLLAEQLKQPDASDYVRFFRWHLLLNQYSSSPIKIIFGLGPSYAGSAVDGSYLRMFVEGGLIGLVAWGIVIREWFVRREKWFQLIAISLMTSMLFIDSVYSFRIMTLFWLLFAMSAFAGKGEKGEAYVSK